MDCVRADNRAAAADRRSGNDDHDPRRKFRFDRNASGGRKGYPCRQHSRKLLRCELCAVGRYLGGRVGGCGRRRFRAAGQHCRSRCVGGGFVRGRSTGRCFRAAAKEQRRAGLDLDSSRRRAGRCSGSRRGADSAPPSGITNRLYSKSPLSDDCPTGAICSVQPLLGDIPAGADEALGKIGPVQAHFADRLRLIAGGNKLAVAGVDTGKLYLTGQVV